MTRHASKSDNQCSEPRNVPATSTTVDEEQQPGTSGITATNSSVSVDQQSSMTTRLLAETVPLDDTCSYVEFAKFEAIPNSHNSKRFAIVFPFANCVLPVHIVRSARIGQLIGLACHIYTRQQREPPCEPPSQYELFLAEEDSMEFDTELPSQDRRRLVADCGFPALAMVARRDAQCRQRKHSGSRESSLPDGEEEDNGRRQQANIFLTDGRFYVMQLDSLDVPLKQVFDYALERKKVDDEKLYQYNAENFLDADYVLETYDRPGRALDLANSVCSIGSHDFVLIRVNSARGEQLLVMPLALRQGWSAIGPANGTAQQRQSLTQSRSMVNFTSAGHNIELDADKKSSLKAVNWPPQFSRMAANECASAAIKMGQAQISAAGIAKSSLNSMTTLGQDISALRLAQFLQQQQHSGHKLPMGGGDEKGGPILGQYEVHRIHRFQPKTPSRLVLRDHCLELVPIVAQQQQQQQQHRENESRHRKLSATAKTKRSTQHIKRIPWELVATAEVPPHSEQRRSARRTVRIVWLCCSLPTKVQKRLDQQQQLSAELIFAIFECCIWKTLLIETAGHEAWNIGVRLSELLDHRPSAVHSLYQHSSGASIRPSIAADRAFGTIKDQLRSANDNSAVVHQPIVCATSSSSTIAGTASSLLPVADADGRNGADADHFQPGTISTVSSTSACSPPFSDQQLSKHLTTADHVDPDQQLQHQQQLRKQQRNRLSAMLLFPFKRQHNDSK